MDDNAPDSKSCEEGFLSWNENTSAMCAGFVPAFATVCLISTLTDWVNIQARLRVTAEKDYASHVYL